MISIISDYWEDIANNAKGNPADVALIQTTQVSRFDLFRGVDYIYVNTDYVEGFSNNAKGTPADVALIQTTLASRFELF